MALLIVERGNEKGRRAEVPPGGKIVFGRDPSCDLVTTDHLCAPRHFEVTEIDGACYVLDLGSEHGTLVNERRVTHKYKLRAGDVIHVGETQLSFNAPEATAAKSANRMVAGYRILEKLGRGGMGAVYKANQVSLNRIVALKILSHRIAADPAFVKRFQAEAQAAGRLNHPNIVQVYDVGFDQGLHYYSMEFIENGSVQDLATREGALDIELALSIITDAARGLVYAEKRGLVHRDIKPDNLMINSEGVVKIADLGLALDGGERARHAGEGSKDEEDVFGTPQFISPEQAQGKTVDTRSDIYSLGASFYRLMTGQPPFTGENITEIVRKQIEETPQPVRELRPQCPQALATIIERAMQKDPAERFQTAQDLLTALEAADETTSGKGGRGGLIAAGLALVAVAGGVAFFALRPKPETKPFSQTPIVDTRPASRSASDAVALASAQRERDAARAAREASDLEKEQIASGKPDLARVRERYQDVASRFPDTPDGHQAAERVAAIDREISETAARDAAARAAAESRAVAAKEAITAALRTASELETSDRFTAALQALRAVRTQVAGTDEAPRLDGAVRELADLAEARAAKLSSDSAAAEAEGRLDAAEKLLADALAAFAPTGSETDPAVETAATRLQSALTELRGRAGAKRAADVAADAAVIDQARKEAYRELLMSFDTQATIAMLDAAKARLRGAESAALLADDRAMVDAMARVRDRWVASVPADESKGLRVKIPTGPDRKKLVDHTVVRADSKGFTAKRGSADSTIPFASFSAPEAYDLLFADLVEKDAALRPDAVDFLLFIGQADRALELAQGMADGEAKQRALGRAEKEQKAWALLADVRDLTQRAQTDESALGRLYRAVTRLIAEFADTRAYLLHRRSPTTSQPASRPDGR